MIKIFAVFFFFFSGVLCVYDHSVGGERLTGTLLIIVSILAVTDLARGKL